MQYTKRIDQALKLATQLHHGQVRKDAMRTPYIMHPVAVMCILSHYTSDEDILIAALLHDVLEDVKLPYAEKELLIAESFGARVLDIVRGVTEEKDPMSGLDEKIGWKERKLKYLAHLETSPEESMLVSIADKIHNLLSMEDGIADEGDAFWCRFNAPEGKLWFYDEAVRVVEKRIHDPMVQELRDRLEAVRSMLGN